MRGKNVFSDSRSGPGRFVFIAFLLLIAVFGVHVVIDNGSAVVLSQKVLVSNLPGELEGFTVLHLSDLQGKRFGPRQKQLEAVLRGKKYNAVCLTGNMIGPRGDVYPLYELLSILDPTKPVYFIAGDLDPAVKTREVSPEDWKIRLQARGAVFLEKPAYITIGKSKVWFSDASQLPLDLNNAKAAYEASASPESTRMLDVIMQNIALRKEMLEDELHIALSAMPVRQETMATLQSVSDPDMNKFLRSVDLILAGGTAGGQWDLPLIGPVWSAGFFPKAEMVRGYHYVGSFLQYISGGLGTLSNSPLPKFRVMNTPEMALITFTSKMDEDVLPGS